MTKRTFGMLAAGAVASLLGSAAIAAEAAGSDAKGCYRPHCGKSVKGHEGQCGGTKVEGLTDQSRCETAGGAWTTEAAAAGFKKKG